MYMAKALYSLKSTQIIPTLPSITGALHGLTTVTVFYYPYQSIPSPPLPTLKQFLLTHPNQLFSYVSVTVRESGNLELTS